MVKCCGVGSKEPQATRAPEVYEKRAKYINYGANTFVVLGVVTGAAAAAASVAAIILLGPASAIATPLIVIIVVTGAGAAGTVSFSLFMTAIGLKNVQRKNLQLQASAIEQRVVRKNTRISDLEVANNNALSESLADKVELKAREDAIARLQDKLRAAGIAVDEEETDNEGSEGTSGKGTEGKEEVTAEGEEAAGTEGKEGVTAEGEEAAGTEGKEEVTAEGEEAEKTSKKGEKSAKSKRKRQRNRHKKKQVNFPTSLIPGAQDSTSSRVKVKESLAALREMEEEAEEDETKLKDGIADLEGFISLTTPDDRSTVTVQEESEEDPHPWDHYLSESQKGVFPLRDPSAEEIEESRKSLEKSLENIEQQLETKATEDGEGMDLVEQTA